MGVLKIFYFLEKQFFLISRSMLFSTLKKKKLKSAPSDVVSQIWGWLGGGGVMFFLYFMLFTTFLEKINLGIQFFFLEKKQLFLI